MAASKIFIQNKDEEIFGLMKVPDSVLLREARIEIGQLKAYIEELEEKIKSQDIQLQDQIKAIDYNLEKDSKVLKLKNKVKEQAEKICKLKGEVEKLTIQQMGAEWKEFFKAIKKEGFYNGLSKQIESLKKDNEFLRRRNEKMLKFLADKYNEDQIELN